MEIVVVLVLVGLLLGAGLVATELVASARVNSLIAQQDGIRAAFLAFEERYRAPPGDYARATLNISRTTQNGDGNSRIEANAAINESILAWEHLSRSGFLARSFTYNSTESQSTSPINSYGVYLQIIYDGIYGAGTTANPSTSRHAIKTGSQIPVSTIAEVDRKIDDGAPNSGAFQFSRYQGNAPAAPTDGTTAPPSCTSAADASGTWNATNGSHNCGGASLL